MSLKQEFELLRRVPIFAEIEPAKLKLLAFMSERVGFDPGKRLMQQGDPADAAYLIIDGHAEVILEDTCRTGDRGDTRRQRLRRRDGDLGRRAAQRDGPRQRPSRRPAHLEGAVHAHGARIPDHGGLDHAGTGAPRSI